MGAKLDLTGKKFNRLLVTEYSHSNKHNKRVWWCLCDCGKTVEVISSALVNGHVKSCGCLQKEAASAARKTHGKSYTKENSAWRQMKRTYSGNTFAKDYYNSLQNDNLLMSDFNAFLEEIGHIPDEHKTAVVVRKDESLGIVKGNIYWDTSGVRKNYKGAKKKKISGEVAVEKVAKKHNYKYVYNPEDYQGANSTIKVTCPDHGEFTVRFSDHLSGQGCPVCTMDSFIKRLSNTREDIVNKCVEVHGDLFDYSRIPTDFYGTKNKIEIVCTVCGAITKLRASHHMCGQGCSTCAKNGFNENKDGAIYLLNCGNIFKVGITNRRMKERLREINKDNPNKFEVLFAHYTDGWLCRPVEKELLQMFQNSDNTVEGTFNGVTETFISEEKTSVVEKFLQAIENLPKKGETQPPEKKPVEYETPEQRRARLSAKTGLPVGVVQKYGRWYFQIITRESGKKDKKPLGSFNSKEICIAYAEHYWNTGELLDNRENLMVYNEYGLYKGITPAAGKFRASFNKRVDGVQVRSHVGTFNTEEEALAAMIKEKELLDV